MGSPIPQHDDAAPASAPDPPHGDPAPRIVLLTPDWSRALDASTTCRFQLRLSREDILAGTTAVFDPTDDRLGPAREEQRRTGRFAGRLRLQPKEGTPFEATVSVTSVDGTDVEVAGPRDLAVLEYDVDRQVPTGLERQWSRHPLHHSPDVVALYEADGTLRYISPSVTDVLGYAPEEMTGQVTIDLVHPDDVEPMIDAMLAVGGTTGPAEPVVFRVRHRDGRWRHLEVMLRDLSEDPEVGGSTVHFRDITHRVEQLGASYFDGLTALDGPAAGVANIGTDGRPVRFNDRFAEVLGRSREALLGLADLGEAVHPEDREGHRAEVRRVADGGSPRAREWRFLRPDGTVAWVSSTVQRPVVASVLSDLLVVSVTDVTARKDAERAWALLSPREQEVLGLLVRGLRNRDIAGALHVSIHTVKHHVQSVLRKLEVTERAHAVARVAPLEAPPDPAAPRETGRR
ncbi:PAS domain S-box protein [Nocardioides aurantiacus]|uniref:PAS domain S-box-containing protein n=1 Tax=Nocardioides aurantiacus TaxID=86796 RepID=A0A3N2CPE5_9ACTN|nr:PAS domain S-box protein [Nocardioides aurantiacus]ROR89385.1 PAS domain S-box-containing protein [Nocardioides aurantiacus]